MIKQGRNIITCEQCKEEIKQTKDLIETKYQRDGIQIQFFRCNHCGAKYIVCITDNATRLKRYELINWAMQRSKALDIVIEGMSEEEQKKLAMLADECLFNMDRLQNEIKVAMAELKKKHGELL